MSVQPCLFLEGHSEEALEHYHRALGAEVMRLMRYSDSPEPQAPGMLPPGSEKKIMHSEFGIGDTTLKASDGMCGGKTSFGVVADRFGLGWMVIVPGTTH